ncbi:MAG: hypothetical protein SFU99_16975 [Saprospiraceae bacterium]|nr:hypothetical protein [Saprospiraceae bacterium]
MKSIFFVIIIAISSILPESMKYITTAAAKEIEVEVEAELGRKKKDCTGFGICSVVLSTGGIKLDAGGRMTLTESQNSKGSTFELKKFNITRIDKEVANEHFVRDSILDFMPESLQTQLKINGKESTVHIKSGNYKIAKTKGGYLLSR